LYGHSPDYIKEKGALELEGFAHMGGAQFNGVKVKLFEEYLGETLWEK
jgi:hypothetical protein